MLKAMAEKWLGPAGLTVVLGLVIWLVQLNAGFVSMRALIEKISVSQDRHDEQVAELVVTQAKTAQILIGIERRMVKVEAYTDHDDDRVESIDKKVLINDGLIRNHIQNHRRNSE